VFIENKSLRLRVVELLRSKGKNREPARNGTKPWEMA